MPEPAPSRLWWTATELAEAGLPDLPGTKRSINRHAEKLGWQLDGARARRRAGRGGGWEYHWTLLPQRAQAALLATAGVAADADDGPMGRDEAWEFFEGLSDAATQRARERLEVIQVAEALEAGGATRDQAVRDAACRAGKSPRAVWDWLARIEGVRTDDRLPYLADRHRAGARKSRAAEVDPEFGALVKSDYLRLEKPSLRQVHRNAERLAKEKGIPVAPYHTVQRWLKRTVSVPTLTLMREGREALWRMYPPMVRDRTAFHAMQAVNADFHKFDVFVEWPSLPGQNEPAWVGRPQGVFIQDLRSNRILAWRIDQSANSHAVQLAIGDMVETWGIPEHVLFDNGKEFAAKRITGGAQSRFRFKVKDDDVPGILQSLGCHVHWATPGRGQSKPIERAFGDFAVKASKDIRMRGAYVGNKPDAKPENAGTRIVPLADFVKVVAEYVEEYNLRPDRRSEVAYGRSFADVFDESYAQAPIRKATEAQRRLWLMGAEGLCPHKRTGAITLHGNEYWAEFLHAHRGEKLVARFDTADLWAGIHVYTLNDEYLGHAECRQKTGFFDLEGARAFNKARGAFMKAERAAAKAHKRLSEAELGARLDAAAPALDAPVTPEAKVVRMVPTKAPRPAVAPAPPTPEEEAAQAALVEDLAARRAAKTPAPPPADDARTMFLRARDLEHRLEAGEELPRDALRWLKGYQTTPEYRAFEGMIEHFGEAHLAE